MVSVLAHDIQLPTITKPQRLAIKGKAMYQPNNPLTFYPLQLPEKQNDKMKTGRINKGSLHIATLVPIQLESGLRAGKKAPANPLADHVIIFVIINNIQSPFILFCFFYFIFVVLLIKIN